MYRPNIQEIVASHAEFMAELEDSNAFQFVYDHIMSCNNWNFQNYHLTIVVMTDRKYIRCNTCDQQRQIS